MTFILVCTQNVVDCLLIYFYMSSTPILSFINTHIKRHIPTPFNALLILIFDFAVDKKKIDG